MKESMRWFEFPGLVLLRGLVLFLGGGALVLGVGGCDGDGPPPPLPVDVENVEGGKTKASVASPVTNSRVVVPGVPEDSNTRMARRLAEKFDALWEVKPEAGHANLRFLLRVDGEPLAGKLDVMTDFRVEIRASKRGQTHSQGFNPNSNGRFVYTRLRPGHYTVRVESVGGEYAGWSRDGVEVAEGDSPLFEVNLAASK